MPSKSQERRLAAQREANEESAPQKRYYFPDVGNGITVMATSIEEANEKAAALAKEREGSGDPAEDSTTND